MDAPAVTVRKVIHTMLLSKGRMEALTDGIFAIAMTLLVLELKVPEAPKSIGSRDLLHLLGGQGAAFFSFAVSFVYCGLLWIMHHLAGHFFRHIQIGLAWLNLIFLMFISLLPFSCALLGHFLHNRAALEIYFGNMFLAALMLAIQWQFARIRKLLNEDDPRGLKAMGYQVTMFLPALAFAMVVAWFKPDAGFTGLAVGIVGVRLWQRKTFRAAA